MLIPILGLLLCAGRYEVKAEGSKNLTPGTTSPRAATNATNDYVGYLQQNDGNNTREFLNEGSSAAERMYVHVEPNETVHYGVHRMNYNNTHTSLRIQLRYISAGTSTINTVMSTQINPATGTNPNNALLAAGPGVIDNPAQASVGPNYDGTVTGGYNPLSYTNITGSAQEFWLEFVAVNTDGSVVANKVRTAYDIWDVTVRAATGEKTGRLYSQSWGFTAGSDVARLASTFSLYPLIPNPNYDGTYFIKRVDYAGMQPWGVLLTANSYGVSKASGTYKDWRKSRGGSFNTAEYKLFVNDPDPAIYPTTIRPSAPTISTSCRSDNKGAIFTLRVDQAGFGTIFIDGNNNKIYEAANDRLLEGLTQKGDNQFDWDGTSDTGVTMPSGNINITYSSGVGPVNFPIFDAENNTGGIIIREVRPGNTGNIDYAFWDDANLTNFPAPQQNPYGINSAEGAHKWSGNIGDVVTVNTYAVGLIARNQSNNITYNNGSCLVIAPVILPVELTSFTATAQKQQVALRWATASEKNSAQFVVERSLDGRRFEAVGQVAAQGNSASTRIYTFLDPISELSGSIYYRLRQLDLDQTAHLSPVVTVQLAAVAGTLYPNPATSEVAVRFAAPLPHETAYTVLNAAGQVVQHGTVLPGAELRISVADLPANGLYLLRVGTHTYRFSK
ncbi:T9SS type A sorting domain-containing protein [Hymenobacter aerilatus]|uniref:T9SS type A sorting domain-containing protein n=1 Tax=Hymenobacter aerilatus TaxID=2932251 RepID=A0A8T9STU2_9BACT|nr:T9SS type A sorting domain-containing protein [Hymenobacter aerilatus]UOR05157.1 T9SS type A sorting domain-containing protein [Hymenobacter aerilatus]